MSKTSPIVPGRLVGGGSNTYNLQVKVDTPWTLGCMIERVADTSECPITLIVLVGSLDGEQEVQQQGV